MEQKKRKYILALFLTYFLLKTFTYRNRKDKRNSKCRDIESGLLPNLNFLKIICFFFSLCLDFSIHTYYYCVSQN